MVLEGSRAGGHFNMPQSVQSLRQDSRRRQLRSKMQGPLREEWRRPGSWRQQCGTTVANGQRERARAAGAGGV